MKHRKNIAMLITTFPNHIPILFIRSFFEIRRYKKASDLFFCRILPSCVESVGMWDRLNMKRAEHLLMYTKKSVTDISLQVGISDTNYFTKLFKKAYGKTPLNYRKTKMAVNAGDKMKENAKEKM